MTIGELEGHDKKTYVKLDLNCINKIFYFLANERLNVHSTVRFNVSHQTDVLNDRLWVAWQTAWRATDNNKTERPRQFVVVRCCCWPFCYGRVFAIGNWRRASAVVSTLRTKLMPNEHKFRSFFGLYELLIVYRRLDVEARRKEKKEDFVEEWYS